MKRKILEVMSLSIMLLTPVTVLSAVLDDSVQQEVQKYEFMLEAKQEAYNEYAKNDDVVIIDADEIEAKKQLEALEMAKAEKAKDEIISAVDDDNFCRVADSYEDSDVSNLVNQVKETNKKIKETNKKIKQEKKRRARKKKEAAKQAEQEAKTALIEGVRTDDDYTGTVISITGSNRDNLERLVMGEAGNQGYVGAALVAQTLRDTMVSSGITDVVTIKHEYGYSGALSKTPNEDVKNAVAFIFDEGGMAVKHRLKYFYAPRICSSKFHESQKFIVEYNDHRFFSEW